MRSLGYCFMVYQYGFIYSCVALWFCIDASMADADFKKELKILMTFEPHPNIIQLMGVCTETGR